MFRKTTQTFVILSLFVCASAHAQTKVKIKKIKGKSVLLKTARPTEFQEGDILYLTSEPPGTSSNPMSSMGGVGGPFKYSLGASFGYYSISSEADGGSSNDTSLMELQARFGIIKDKKEFGGVLEYSTWDLGFGTSIDSMVLGGFGEFNIDTKSGPSPLVPAVGGYFAYVSQEFGSTKTSGFRLQPYGRAKFFAATDIAITGELGLRYERLSADGGSDVTNTGFVLSAGLTWYIR